MCGIAGVVRGAGRIVEEDRAALARMLRAEAHRGPDGEGCYADETVLLGHVRLAIIDLSSAGRQPMPNETGDVWVSVNGEIYNFKELRSELRSAGHTFRSETDAEVLLHGYESWGMEGLLARLRGMYAFALYDARDSEGRKLFLVRDRFGIKPLYYAPNEDKIVFASELTALVASGLVPPASAPDALVSFLTLGSIPGPGTALEHVKVLPAAHYLEIRGGTETLRRYWSLPAPEESRELDAGALREVGELLEESVRMHLVSDVPLGVFLSGGMDSATLVALASESSSSPLATLSVVFDEPGLDEALYARKVAERYGTMHQEVRIDGDEFLETLPDVFRAMDSPTIDGVNSFFISRAARQAGLTVVLSGLGGDEVFLGYPHFAKLRTLSPYAPWLARAPKTARKLLAKVAKAVAASASHTGHEKLDYLETPNPTNLYLLFRGLFSPRQITQLVPGYEGHVHEDSSGGDLLVSAVRLEFDSYLQHQLLRDTDVMSMTHSLEARVPFLDHRLVEAVFRLPHRAKLSRSVNKPLLLRSLREPLPREVWDRPKQGFTLPFQRWLGEHRDELLSRTLAAGVFKGDAVEKLWRAFGEGRAHWSRPWALLAFTAWLARLRDLHTNASRNEPIEAIAEVSWQPLQV